MWGCAHATAVTGLTPAESAGRSASRVAGGGPALAARDSAGRRFEHPTGRLEAEAAVRRLARMRAESGSLEGRPELRTATEAVLRAGNATFISQFVSSPAALSAVFPCGIVAFSYRPTAAVP